MIRSLDPPPLDASHPLCAAFQHWTLGALPFWPLTRLVDFLLVDVRCANFFLGAMSVVPRPRML